MLLRRSPLILANRARIDVRVLPARSGKSLSGLFSRPAAEFVAGMSLQAGKRGAAALDRGFHVPWNRGLWFVFWNIAEF
jgi:hypothetical protein